jgi:hypothetical protein
MTSTKKNQRSKAKSSGTHLRLNYILKVHLLENFWSTSLLDKNPSELLSNHLSYFRFCFKLLSCSNLNHFRIICIFAHFISRILSLRTVSFCVFCKYAQCKSVRHLCHSIYSARAQGFTPHMTSIGSVSICIFSTR